jgi:RNA polymerase sigma-70 factor (ECF subfamily)
MDPSARVARYGPLVWALCRRLDPQPEDAYQEIWEKALKARFDLDGPASYATWLTTIAHRHLVDRHRRRTTRGVEDECDELPDPGPDAPELLARHGTNVRLEAALAALPEAHRRVVVLHHVHEVPLDAIAASEGVPLGTVKSRLHRARAALAERMR